jgi:hypothetical protein
MPSLSAIAINVAGLQAAGGGKVRKFNVLEGWQEGRQAGMAEIITHFSKMCGRLYKSAK